MSHPENFGQDTCYRDEMGTPVNLVDPTLEGGVGWVGQKHLE